MKNKLLAILTPEQLQKELKCLGSVTKIAEKYKINSITVYSAFKKCNINYFVKPRRNNLLNKEVLEKAYIECGSLKAVGRKFGVASNTVKYYMQKYNLDFKPQVRYDCNHYFFSDDNEKSFYIAGFIAADGCVKIHKKGNSFIVQIGISKLDKNFLEHIKSILRAEAPIRDFIIKNSKLNSKWNDTWKSELSITSKQMFHDLSRFNIIPCKSLTYTFPEWLINHPLKHHFMRGYNDGDGSFYIPRLAEGKKTKQVYFSLRGTPKFLEIYRSILEKECDLEIRNKSIRISSGHGCLEYGGNGIVTKIANYLYKDATIYLPRKYDVVMAAKNFI
jgi:hypothetical protein